tara:strand:- start:159 stop:809 length:651 start_codon:yes stop_codon:yes gene_type:complete
MTQGTPIVQVNDRLRRDPPTSPPTDTAKQNFVAQQYGNSKGHIAFGKIHKQGDVTQGVSLNVPDGEHQLSLDIDGPREGWTCSTSPGNFQVECGSANEEEVDSLILEAKNGNIIIKASNGKIRMEATDIEMVTTGDGGGKGNIKINSGNDIIIHAEKKYLVTSGSYIKMASSGDFECAANSVMSIYGSLFNAITDAVKKKPAKNGGQQELEKNNEV